MGQVFRPSANALSKISVFALFLIVVEAILLLTIYFRSNYWREVHIGIPQPVPFSHQLHSGQLGMDCRYCHTSVQQSTFANIPATETCMTCHSQVAQNSTSLAPVRESWATGNPVEWNKVNKVPDFVYFNHSSHVNKGVGCYTCHGRIDQMAVVWKEHPFYMGWCLDCHRQPEKYLRPRDQVFNMEYVPPANQLQLGAQLVAEYNVNKAQLANCAVCHR